MSETEIGWVIESSKDGDRWRFLGKGWTREGEPLLVHSASTFLRFRRLDEGAEEWSPPLQRNGDHPMTFLDLSAGTRLELWPADEHVGLPVLLPGGEEAGCCGSNAHQTVNDSCTRSNSAARSSVGRI